MKPEVYMLPCMCLLSAEVDAMRAWFGLTTQDYCSPCRDTTAQDASE